MTIRKLRKKIRNRKILLDFTLLFLKRTNPLVVKLSQNLDRFIVKEQKLLMKKRAAKKSKSTKKIYLKKAS